MQYTELGFAFVTSAIGALGGLGGAVLLVPLLVLTGTSPRLAAPLGLVSVAIVLVMRLQHRLGQPLVRVHLDADPHLVEEALEA